MFCQKRIQKYFAKFTGTTSVGVAFFNKVDYVTVYFHFWFYKLFLLMEPFKSVPQSSCSAKFRKSHLKTPEVAELQTETLQ